MNNTYIFTPIENLMETRLMLGDITCDCYPDHCFNEDHAACWCDPEEIHMEDGYVVIIHQEEN